MKDALLIAFLVAVTSALAITLIGVMGVRVLSEPVKHILYWLMIGDIVAISIIGLTLVITHRSVFKL